MHFLKDSCQIWRILTDLGGLVGIQISHWNVLMAMSTARWLLQSGGTKEGGGEGAAEQPALWLFFALLFFVLAIKRV